MEQHRQQGSFQLSQRGIERVRVEEAAAVVDAAQRARDTARALCDAARIARANARAVVGGPYRFAMGGLVTMDTFAITAHEEPDGLRLELSGELDIGGARRLREHVESVINADGQRPSSLMVDLTGLSYCDSSGIHELIDAANHCRERALPFKVVGARASVKRVIELTNTAEIMNLES